jgi:hypothetical protein
MSQRYGRENQYPIKSNRVQFNDRVRVSQYLGEASAFGMIARPESTEAV